MPVTPPPPADIARIGQHYPLDLGEPDLTSFQALAATLLASYEEVDRL